jgi:Flp pilus assembly protein TadD
MNPYDPATRELAAACAIEAGRFDDAHRHIESLTILEPDEPRHATRLRAVERLLGGE